MKAKKVQFHSAYLMWLPSGVDDGYQLIQKQASLLSSLVMSWLDDEWTRWWVVGQRDDQEPCRLCIGGGLVGFVSQAG